MSERKPKYNRLMDKNDILPPGQHPSDPSKPEIDPIGYSLDRLQTNLIWIDEHRSSFEQLRHTNPDDAENELRYLRDAAQQALTHLQRLMELVLTGYTVDPNKRLPQTLIDQPDFLRSYLTRLKEAAERSC